MQCPVVQSLDKPFSTVLTFRSLLQLTGRDVPAFLQGLITQDIHRLDQQPLLYTLFLTPQGRFFAEAFIFRRDDVYYLDIPAQDKDRLLSYLPRYSLRRDVVVQALAGGEVLASDGPMPDGDVVALDPRCAAMGYRGYRLHQVCGGQGEGPEQLYRQRLVALGLPEGQWGLVVDKTLPLEANMDVYQGFAWDKGCYIGQELSVRTHRQGVIRKRYLPFWHPQEAGPELPEAMGTVMVSMAQGGGVLGLARVRLEHLDAAMKSFGVFVPKTLANLVGV